MEAFFLKLVNMSITASYLVAAVLVLRLFLKRAPKWIHCALWALVALRLLLPFSLESALSLIPNPEPLPEEFLYAATPQLNTGVSSIDTALNPVIAESLTPSELTSANPTQIQSFVFSRLWIVGMALMLLYAAISYFIVLRKVRISIALDKTIRLCDHIDTPFILGIFRPKIYLPSDLDPMTAAHVLSHEQAHLKRWDHWWKPLGFALLSVYWFNPVLWLAYILLCRDIEQACDEKVVRELDASGKKAYSMALLQCSVPRKMISACPLAFGEVGVKNRIKSVLNYRKPAFWVILVAVAACVGTAVCFLTDPKDSGPSAYEVTSDLWIYDTKTVDITVHDDQGSHVVHPNRLEIERLSEIIHYLEEDEFVKKKPKGNKVYAVLNCEGYKVNLYWDGEYAYFSFDAETDAEITSDRRSVKNEELNAFLSEIAQREYRLAVGTYAPVKASLNAGWEYNYLSLAQAYRYEVADDAFIIHDLNAGTSTSYAVDWSWEDFLKANERIPLYKARSAARELDILDPELNDLTLKYQYISEDYHLLSQNGILCLLEADRFPNSDFIDWKAYRLIADHPQLLPPKTLSECIARLDEANTGSAFNRSGDRRPGFFGMTEDEISTFCSIIREMPEDVLTPGDAVGIDYYIGAFCDKYSENAINFGLTFYYDYECVTLRWYDQYTEEVTYYQVDYAPLKDFLESMMQPERIDSYVLMIDIDNPTYVSYTNEDIKISLIKAECWDYEIVPYTDDHTAFGIRAKPEWLEDWLFFGYMPGGIDIASTGLYQSKITYETVGGDIQWHYLFETPGIKIHTHQEWPEPWRMIYRHDNNGTYFIYNENTFDERLAEHDRGGYMYIERSFYFQFSDEAYLIDSSRVYVDQTKYEKPEVSYDAETNSFNILWHRNDSDGYLVVNIDSYWNRTVIEVAGTESE